MKRIKATFIGKDGSLEYVTGKEYSLYVIEGYNEAMRIWRVSGGGTCAYRSIIAFLNNWTNIKTDTEILKS